MADVQEFYSWYDAIMTSGVGLVLRYVTLMATVCHVIFASTTSEATYLQYLSGKKNCVFITQRLDSLKVHTATCIFTNSKPHPNPNVNCTLS